MTSRYLKIPTASLTLITVALLTACGGGDTVSSPAGAGSPTTPPPVTPPAIMAPVITASLLAAGSASSPGAVVALPNGDSVQYFGTASANGPTEAVVRAAGKSHWIYYDADGSVSRLLDVDSGSYVVVRPRSDLLGSEYLSFDKTNTFTGGTTVFQDANGWFSAPVLGDMGQITASVSAAAIAAPSTPAFNGAMSLRAAQLAYGSAAALPKAAQDILNGQLTTASLGNRLLDLVIPSAYAQSVPAQDRARLNSGMALGVIGNVAFPTAPAAATLFAAAGAANAYRFVVNLGNRNLSQAFTRLDQALEDATSGSFSSAGAGSPSLLDRVRTAVSAALTRGVSSIASATPRTVTQATALQAGISAVVRLPDPTPASYVLPARALTNTAVTGSVVDSAGRVFTAIGSVSSTGALDVTANGPNAETLRVSGTVSTAPGATSGVVTGTVVRAVTGGTSAGVITNGTTAIVGKCAILTQSGGQGTFSYTFNLGRAAGNFKLDYEMYSIPDGMVIVVGGQTVFTTNGLVSGSRSVSVPYTGADTATVNMFAPNSGTAWDFTLGCGT